MTVEIFQFFPFLDNPALVNILHATTERLLQPRPVGVLRGQQSVAERQSLSLREIHAGSEQDPRAGLHEGGGGEQEIRVCEFSGQWSS